MAQADANLKDKVGVVALPKGGADGRHGLYADCASHGPTAG
jgi:hypothetical protein